MGKKHIQQVEDIRLPTRYGLFTVIAYREGEGKNALPHLALTMGDIAHKKNVLVRMHSECLTGDVFASLRCDCGEQLEKAMTLIRKEGSGVLLYLRQEGRGIGLLNKMHAYRLQEGGADTVEANEQLGFPADARTYTIAAEILRDLGLSTIRLLTNNPKKIVGLEGYGLTVVERVPLEVPPNVVNRHYLKTKKEKMGHLIHLTSDI